MNPKTTKILDKIDVEKLHSVLKNDLPENSAILNKDNKLVRQYLGYCSIENDFEFTLLAVEKLIDIREYEVAIEPNRTMYQDKWFLLKRSLYVSAIVNYCRCFPPAKGRLSLNEDFVNSCFPNGSSEGLRFVKFHNKLKNLRNKYIAHADDYYLEQLEAFLQFECAEMRINSRMNYVIVGGYTFDEDEMDMFKNLLVSLLDKLDQKKRVVARNIMEEMPRKEYLEMASEALGSN